MSRDIIGKVVASGLILLAGIAPGALMAEGAGSEGKTPPSSDAAVTLFTYDRLYADDDGETHWETITVDYNRFKYADNIPPIWSAIDGNWQAQYLMLAGNSPGWNARPLHPPRHRQIFIVLTGVTAFTASNGETREYGPGQMILMEDNNSKGHGSFVPSKGPSMVAIIPLEDE